MKEQSLTIQQILEKEFKKKKIGGVDQSDVDEFLNTVIDDYEYFIEKINILKASNQKLRDENYKLKMVEIKNEGEKNTFQEKVQIKQNNNSSSDNVEAKSDVIEQTEAQEKQVDPNLARVEALEKEIAKIKDSLIN